MDNRPFHFTAHDIPGVFIIQPFYQDDTRGDFTKLFEKEIFKEHGIDLSPIEFLNSKSYQGTIRGLHFQHCNCQEKLVSVLKGEIFDVFVDLRQGSKTWGKWGTIRLSEENQTMVYIPRGFAHGYLAIEDVSVHYICGNFFDSKSSDGIRWDDLELSIPWPLEEVGKIIISEKDQSLQTLSEFKSKYKHL